MPAKELGKIKNSMPAQSLVGLCAILNQIEAETKALVVRMEQINEQAARFSIPVGWKSMPESYLAKIQPEEIYSEKPKEAK